MTSEELALRRTTDKERANLIADIVGHPQEAPCIKELDYLNPSLTRAAIRRHLNILQDVGVVKELVAEPNDHVRDGPDKFYTITADSRELFDRHGLFPPGPWKREYRNVERPPEIQELEKIPRPDND